MGTMNRSDAERAAKSIASDIRSRKGIGDEWESLDEDIKESQIWNEMTRGVL